MVRRDFKDVDDDVPGFSHYFWQDTRSNGVLLPTAIAAAIKISAETAAAEKKASTAKVLPILPVLGGKPLPKIRIGTDNDVADAIAFAKKLLKNAVPPALLSTQFSQDLLVAVLMMTTYRYPAYGMADVLYYLIDPLWDSPRQLISELKNAGKAISPSAAVWFAGFDVQLDSLYKNERAAKDLLQAANRHWSTALNKPKRQACALEKPSRTIQVFYPEALEKAVVAIADMNQERQGAGVRILEQARANQGDRTLPDAAQSSMNLEAKKRQFENLVAPIERLQVDLALAAAMGPQEFRISPILLLGAPGIGKTYLANQLAEALGVASEKISAGGAQGGFQLTGSHGAWSGAKPGMIASLLAKSASAAPVLVIDEVDKICDAQYPFLPVLLDLLDAGTAKQFRDEYFEMVFDASKIIVILTANDISQVPPALLSRVDVFTILPPEPSQRLRIIEQTIVELCKKTNRHIAFGLGVAEQLADRMDIDLRQLNRLVNSAFAVALQAGDKVARIKTPDALEKIRFNLTAWTPSEQSC
jgi:ATP-dependent Lon protease